MAASVPREAQMLYQPKEPGPGPGRTHRGLQGWNRDGGSNKRFVQSTSETHLAGRTADCKVGAGTAAATKGCGTGQVRLLIVCNCLWEGGNPVS